MLDKDTLLVLLLAMYCTHHEGEPLGQMSPYALSESEVREIVHDLLCNEGVDPYSDHSRGKVLDLAQQTINDRGMYTHFWSIATALRDHVSGEWENTPR